jgi:hypothetical protein
MGDCSGAFSVDCQVKVESSDRPDPRLLEAATSAEAGSKMLAGAGFALSLQKCRYS